jgi:hypothetical protein
MREQIATCIDGIWQQLPVNDAHTALTALVESPHANPIDVIVRHLGEVVRLAQGLSETDARRARDFILAASSMLAATTYLPKNDQAIFESTLREIAKR